VEPNVPPGPLRSLSEVHRLIDYDRAVFDRFVRRLSRLPWAEVSREREIGHRTLFGTLVHILHVQEVWMVYLVRGRTRELPALFAESARQPTTWKEFRAYSQRVWTGVDATVGKLTVRDLDRRVRAPWFPKGRYTVGDAVLQTTLEEAHHLGEIIGALWQDDRPSPPMTWIEVTRTQPRPRRTKR
jgi:uncharacterized damage-inducible protein DinB